MNSILNVKMPFRQETNPQSVVRKNLRKDAETSIEKIDSLIEDLRAVLRYYQDTPKIIKNILIDVNYNDIIAKSRRINELLKPNRKNTNEMVVGARFSDAPDGEENHIITYYVDVNTINETIMKLETLKEFISDKFSGTATSKNFNEPECKIDYTGYSLSKSRLRNLVVDCSVVESFSVPKITSIPDKDSFLVTLYKTELRLSNLLEKIGIDRAKYPYYIYGDDSISVSRELFEILDEKVPYLISMVSSDLSRITMDEINSKKPIEEITIPNPSTEPIIGVIDTFFDENVYFKKWVENIDYLEDIERMTLRDPKREHGTEVTSIIVDGPRLNPWLDDGCGRFRVRHFGVCEDKISTFRLVKKIKEIVSQNPDIHVWNLSLGTDDEVSKNFISYDAAALDELQSDKNIIFVISGTNDNRKERPDIIRVGSPADSLNSIVVNSVKRNGSPASYTRKGNILSFFNKPDVSYYGGDFNERIKVYSSLGEQDVYGTSYAAPWISRKLCYLIDVMGLPKEIAKALIIDSAAGWEYKQSTYRNKDMVGYGVVPINIDKILKTADDEIKFIVYGTSVTYNTTNYTIPIPKDDNDKYPYIARAVICYFPECSRTQGVDYTNRELSLKFGRINNKDEIDDINENIQDEVGAYVDERQSRREFRKWENSKFISKILRKNKPLKSYEERLWGISIISKERLSTRMNRGLNFGVVVTLKEISGVNRIQDFIKACTLRGWIVNELNVENQIEIYNNNQEEITFE